MWSTGLNPEFSESMLNNIQDADSMHLSRDVFPFNSNSGSHHFRPEIQL